MWPLAVLTGDKSSLTGDVWPFRRAETRWWAPGWPYCRGVRSTVNGKPLHRCNLTISGDEIVKKISKNIHRNNPLLALLNTVRCGRNFFGPDTPISQWKNQWGLDWDAEVGRLMIAFWSKFRTDCGLRTEWFSCRELILAHFSKRLSSNELRTFLFPLKVQCIRASNVLYFTLPSR